MHNLAFYNTNKWNETIAAEMITLLLYSGQIQTTRYYILNTFNSILLIYLYLSIYIYIKRERREKELLTENILKYNNRSGDIFRFQANGQHSLHRVGGLFD